MLIRLVFALLLGIVWVNLMVLLMFRSGLIYRFITKKGEMRSRFEGHSRRWLWLGAVGVIVYLTLSDFLVLGYNDHSFPSVLFVNLGLMLSLLLYNALVINQWLLVVVRPMILNVSKMMTPITIKSYTRFTVVQGGVSALILSMISGWLYLILS